jgi:LCP family protein required for cell wall assembly
MFGLSPTLGYAVALVAVGVVIFAVAFLAPRLLWRDRPGRSWFQRSVLSFNIWLVVVCLISASALAYLNNEVAAIPVVSIGEDVLAEEVEPGEPQNFLLVGVDRAQGLDEGDPVNIGRSPNSLLSDTIMVMRFDPQAGTASLLSFPRDLWIPIAGTGGKQRINTALPTGGPEMLIETIEQDFGIPIHHYAQVDFRGFKDLVGTIGGVPMFFPQPVRDQRTGLFVNVGPEGGCVTLDADQALSFVRSRAFQTYGEDGWETDPSGDIGRSSRQQEFIRLAIDRAIDRGLRDPRRLDQVLSAAQSSVTLDDALTIGDIVDLAKQYSEFGPDDLQTYSLPTTGGRVGEASVLFLDEAEAQPIFDVFRGVSAHISFVAAIRVGVRNGTGELDQGSKVYDELADRGFSVTTSSEADSFDYERTVIQYAPGEIGAAIILARWIDVDAELVETDGLGEDTVVLVTGADFGEVLDEPRPAEEFEHLLPERTDDTTATTTASSLPPTTAVGDVPDQAAQSC